MKTFKIRMFFLVLMTGFFCSSTLQSTELIEVKRVRQDLLKADNVNVPKDWIESVNEGAFKFFYFKDLCLVHLYWKDIFSEAFMRTAVVVSYKREKDGWVLASIFPYNYNVELFDKEKKVFISKNMFCSPRGECSLYQELSRFENGDIFTLEGYVGFYRYPYYHFQLEDDQDLSKSYGDTISSEKQIENVKLSGDTIFFDMNWRFGILKKVVDDSLVVEDESIRKTSWKIIK